MTGGPDWFPDGHEVREDEVDRWLSLRRFGVGASEVAACMNCDPHKTPLRLYRMKAEGLVEGAGEPAEIGKVYEASHAAMYLRRTGRRIVKSQVFYRHAEFDRVPLFATIDGIDEDGVTVEFKMRGNRRDIGREGTDELPYEWVVQAHAQMLCDGSDRVNFGVLYPDGGHRFRIFPVHRDGSLCGQILAAVERFWRDHVAAGVPPRAVEMADLEAVERSPDLAVPLPDAAAALADRYERIAEESRALEKEKERVRVALTEMLGAASVGLLPDGRRWVASTRTRKESVVKGGTYTVYSLSQPRR